MSHFTVMVIGPNPENQLAPYEEDENGGFWDWYLLGGRWTGYFKLKEGAPGHTGEPGLMTESAKEGFADAALKKDIDFDWMRKKAREAAEKTYDKAHATISEHPDASTWKDIVAKYPEDIQKARAEYHSQPIVKAFNEAGFISLFSDPIEEFSISREKFLKLAECRATSSYAFVRDGKWTARGEMGWFGVSSNEMDENEWHEKVSAMLDELPEDTLISLYDCHI